MISAELPLHNQETRRRAVARALEAAYGPTREEQFEEHDEFGLQRSASKF